ncbi:hypothetical protein MAR_015361, partial [Mya arenaria]
MWTYTLIFVGLVRVGHGQSLEPSSCTWHETNMKVIERLAILETKQKYLEEIISRQQHFIDEWSTCAFKCSGSDEDNGRTQTRTRLLMQDNVAMQNETERRPCNAVQYA